MVVEQHGDNPSHTVSHYVGPSRLRQADGKTFLVDAGTGTVIAEITHAAAEAARTSHAVTVTTFDGACLTLKD